MDLKMAQEIGLAENIRFGLEADLWLSLKGRVSFRDGSNHGS